MLVSDVLNNISVNVVQLAMLTGIPKERIYHWTGGRSEPKAEDALTLQQCMLFYVGKSAKFINEELEMAKKKLPTEFQKYLNNQQHPALLPDDKIKNSLKSINVNNTPLEYKKSFIDLFPQLIENEQFADILQLLPLPTNPNGWIKQLQPGEQLQTPPPNLSTMLYTGIQNGLKMEINPNEYLRIPNLEADRIITVAERNMNGRINKGDKASIRWVDKKDVRFGHIYYIIHKNGDKTINYIRKGQQGYWILKNENTKDFDDQEVLINDIVAIYKIGINIGMNEQIELTA